MVPDPECGIEVKDERRVRLDRIAKEEGEAFVYEYDMGDSWQHQVLVEKVGADSIGAKGRHMPFTRACMPAGGFMTGGPFDPEAFDVDAVNAALKALR